MGGTITSLDPPSIPYQGGEFFLTINGSSLGDRIVFEGGPGVIELEANAVFTGSVVTWIPQEIVNDPGTYTVYTTGRLGESNRVSFSVLKAGRPGFKLHLPEHLTAIAKSRLGTGIKYDVSATGGDSATTSIKCDPYSGSTFPFGQSKITCVGYDGLGNRDDGTIDVTVWDGVPPTLSIPSSFKIPADDERGAYVKFEAAATDDIDGQLRVLCSHDSGALLPNGRTVVNCEATDNALNVSAGSFEVFVEPKDPGRLTLKVPEKVVEVAADPEGGEVFFEVVAYGSADPDPVVECTPPSGWFFPMKVTKVYCTAEDDFGARTEAGFYVEVVERLGLKFPDVTAEATSPTGTEVTWEANAENWTNAIRCTPDSGSIFAMGATTVDCESTDDRGRRAGGKFTVNVADTIAPHIGRIRTNAGNAKGGVVPVQLAVEAIDAGDAMPLCSVTALTADNGGAFDWRVTSDLEVEVRETSHPFRIQVSCVDASGNRATDSVAVTLGERRPRSIVQ